MRHGAYVPFPELGAELSMHFSGRMRGRCWGRKWKQRCKAAKLLPSTARCAAPLPCLVSSAIPLFLPGQLRPAPPCPCPEPELSVGVLRDTKISSSQAVNSNLESRHQVAKEYGMTATELALAWCHSQKHVTSTIIGATSVPQVASLPSEKTRQRQRH